MIESLQTRWSASGIEGGDVVLIHSNITRTLKEYRAHGLRITPLDILDSFFDVVGHKGTLLLPLFNFDFTQGIPFDVENTPSQMGALTEVARKLPGAVRTGHPIYSFAALGYKSSEFKGVNNLSGYGEDSPFAILRELGGKVASLDLDDQSSMTYYHYVEEVKRVDYRYFKKFTGDYTGYDRKLTKKTYQLFVRDLERGVRTNVNPAGDLLWKQGLYKGCRPKEGSGLRVIGAQDFFNFIEILIDSGRALGTLYSIEDSNDWK